MLSYSLWLSACLSLVSAHMQLTYPLPLGSSLDPLNTNPDYSMTSPLAMDGSNFPCKGYLSRADAHVTASFSAGQQATFTLAGSATHQGGSCQVSLSYDGGKTFKVINSILGGCPLQNSYSFQFPSGLPSGNNVVFSWSWFNKVGNREMYQNCALVNIAGTGSSSFLASLPDMQVANVGNGCTSIEGTEVIPVNPGSSLQYGGSYAGGSSAVSGLNGAGLTGTCGTAAAAKPVAGTTSSTKASPSTSTSIKATTSSSVATRAGFGAFPIPSTKASTTTKASSSTTAATTSPASGQNCTNGAIICTGTGYTWSLCSSGTPVAMGAVAPGTICKSGQMVADSAPAGNVAKVTSSTTSRSSSSSTTSKAASPTTTSACLNKRDLRDMCQLFSMKCTSPYSYSLCEGDEWSEARALSAEELCVNDEVVHVARLQADVQSVLQLPVICSGTGITCSEDGTSYFVCSTLAELPVPSGTKCVESNSGGGFVSWQGL